MSSSCYSGEWCNDLVCQDQKTIVHKPFYKDKLNAHSSRPTEAWRFSHRTYEVKNKDDEMLLQKDRRRYTGDKHLTVNIYPQIA